MRFNKLFPPRHRRIFFDGNSLTNQGANGLVGGGRYPTTCYTSIRGLSLKYAMFNYGVGSKRTDELTANFPTKIAPYLRKNDIVVFWEITNDAHDLTSDTNGDLLFSRVVAYCEQAQSYGAKVVCLTGIARDGTPFDDADITSRIQACNLHMTNDPSFCDLLVDVGALSQFNAKADCANTTYYNADKIHLTNTGYDLIATTVYNTMNSSGILTWS